MSKDIIIQEGAEIDVFYKNWDLSVKLSEQVYLQDLEGQLEHDIQEQYPRFATKQTEPCPDHENQLIKDMSH